MQNNWLWKNLFVPAEGRLDRMAYFGALFRIALIYLFGTQVFTAFVPVIAMSSGHPITGNPFLAMNYGALAAQLLIAWPAWSIFKRRMNDARPDLRAYLTNWSIGFPIYLVVLLGVMVAGALRFETPVTPELHGNMRLIFFMMLFGAGFIPGGDSLPSATAESTGERGDLRQQAPMPFEIAPAARSTEGTARQRHVQQPARAPHPLPKLYPELARSHATLAVERTRKLPEQGRVKHGWFS